MTGRVRVLVVCWAWAGSPADGAPYQFVPIADSSGPYSSFHLGPALNVNGEVAFRAWLDDGVEGIFTGPDPTADVIADSRGAYGEFGIPAINDSGKVVFSAYLDDSVNGIYSGPNPTTDVLFDSHGPLHAFGLDMSINEAGEVAFLASEHGGDEGVYIGTDLMSDRVADKSGPIRSFFGRPTINNAGQVVFHAWLDVIGDEAIMRGERGLAPVVVVPRSAELQNLFGVPSINDVGEIAFIAGGPNTFGIHQGPNVPDDTYWNALDGPWNGTNYDPLINNSGQIAFYGAQDSGQQGIYVSPDPQTGKVIAVGDTLFGQAVVGLVLHTGFNDVGQVAFAYELANGITGVALATPVPEPAAIWMVSICILTALPARERRGRSSRQSRRRVRASRTGV